MSAPDPKVISTALHSVGRTFYGGCLENRGSAPLGKGHDNEGLPLDIATCHYTNPIYDAYDAAIRNHIRTEIDLLAGVKTMKSFVLENCAADHVCNRNGDAAIFFGSGDVADTVSTTRIVDDFRGIARFEAKLKTISNVAGKARHQVTNGAIKFPDKTFFLLPANLNETQQKNLGFAGVQDAFVTAATGVIEEIIARTTQYRDAIVFLESQGGEKHFDFDRRYENTNQGELHVLCPICGSPHIFNWKAFDESSMTRGENFVPVPPLSIPSLDRAAWIAHNRPLMLNAENRVAGFQRGPDEKIKNGDGYIASAIIEETHFRCFHCNGIWLDDGEFGPTRIALDKSSFYVSANPSALTNKIGFNFPQWINRRITRERGYGWGHIMLEKMEAHKSATEYGNYEPLKIWWQKKAAKTWDPKAITFSGKVSTGTYDPLKYMEMFGKDEAGNSLFHSVNMAVDCQEDADHKARTEKSITGWFWYVVRAYDKFGNSRQLARGYCKSWEAWRSVQSFWGVPNDRIMIDVVQWSEQVMNKAVEFRQSVKRSRPHPIFKTMEDTVTWKLLAASPGKQNFKGHRDGIIRPWSPESPVYGNMIDEHGRVRRIPLARILFNKTPVQQQVDSLYSGAPGLPKFEVLSREHLKIPSADGKTLVPDTLTISMELNASNGNPTMLAYENQMSAQIYNQEKNKYEELRPDDHWYWCEQALLVRVGMDGLLGNSAVFVAE